MAFFGFNDKENTNIDTRKHKLVKLNPLVCTPRDAYHRAA